MRICHPNAVFSVASVAATEDTTVTEMAVSDKQNARTSRPVNVDPSIQVF